MKRAAQPIASSSAFLLNTTKSAGGGKVAKEESMELKIVDDDLTKTNHYLLTEIKGDEDENEIAFVLTENMTKEGATPLAECREEIQIEEPCQETEGDDDKVNTKEIVEHVCGKCYKSFRSVKVLQRHIKFCLFSSEMESRKAKMLKNIKKIEKEAVVMEKKDLCFCCGESYDTCHLGHINCPECPKTFKSQIVLERHIFLIHSENNDFPCTVCNGRIRTKELLKLHVEQHKNRGKPFACKSCGMDFTRPYHLKRHLMYTCCRDGQLESTKCKVCSKEFFRLDNLRVHLKSHLGQEIVKRAEYNCPFCKKYFYSLSTLNIHIRTHTGERPYDCDLCDKKFPSLVSLKKHRRSHTGEKPYTCSVCHQNFAVKEVLNRHMKRHTGQKPHACDQCDKRFIQATQLRNHRRTHLRPYDCPLCEEKFKTERLRDIHLKTHNRKTKSKKEKTSKKTERTCSECGEEFSDTASLRYHKLKEHTDDNECNKTGTTTRDKEEMQIQIDDDQPISSLVGEKQQEKDDPIKTEKDDCIVIEEFIVDFLPIETANAFNDSVTNFKIIAKDNQVVPEQVNSPKKNISTDLKAELRKSLAQRLKDEPAKVAPEKTLNPDDVEITENVNKLLDILVDLQTLVKFGWLNDTVENVLCKVIENCGYNLQKTKVTEDYGTRMREYVKLLFTVVIQNDSIKELLNNYSIDEVIKFVLANDESDENN